MITVNMHDAKSRLSELVKAAEEDGQVILICRQGQPVAELKAVQRTKRNRLKPHPDLKPLYVARDFDPVAPLTADEWPEDSR
jgi:prevent-host-death family protein